MGQLNNGLFGGFRGRVGNLVGYELMGKDVVRVIGINNKPASPKQIANRQAMKMIALFLNPILEFINVGFSVVAQKANMYPHNMATSYNKKNALQGEYPDLQIDFSKVRVSEGDLLEPQNPQVELVNKGLKFTWDTTKSYPAHTDRAMMMAYFPQLNEAEFITLGAARSKGEDLLELDANQLEQYKEIYIAFIAADRKSVSNSIYLGGF